MPSHLAAARARHPIARNSNPECHRRLGGLSVLIATWLIAAFSPTATALADNDIAGYVSDESVVQGDTLELHVSTGATSYDVLIEDALDPGVVLATLVDLPGQSCGTPDSAFAWGCNWPVAVTVPIDPAWPSGVYYVRLVSHVGGGNASPPDTSFVPFVVREDAPGSTSPILFQLSSTTYQAYNNWGGRSLYPQNSQGGHRSHFVSFERPYDQERGKGEFPWWERPMAAYLRTAGIPVEFCTNRDLHRDPNLLAPYKLFLNVGHDEYYSRAMYDALEAHRAAGGNLAFFSGNSIFWQVRFDGNTMVCYKDLDLDPFYPDYPELVTVNWRQPPLARPEGFLMGVQFDNWCWRPCGTALRVFEPDHWVTRDLGLMFYTPLGSEIVGYEWDRRFNGVEPPGVETVFQTIVQNHDNAPRLAHSTYYQFPPGDPVPGQPFSRIFAAGSIQWSYGVRPDSAGADSTMGTVTRRIVRCLSQPSELAQDREVIFVADLRQGSPAIQDTLWIRGTPAPLSRQEPGLPVLDDGVAPDSVANDQIYTCSITFPAGAPDIVSFEYWTVGRCGYANFSAWIEDPELGPAPVRIVSVPAYCPTATTVDVADLPPASAAAPTFDLRAEHHAGRLRVTIALPAPLAAAEPEPLRVDLYDVSGRLVRRLGQRELTGKETVFQWSGDDSAGRRVAAGVYILRAQLGDQVQALKIVW